MHEISAKDYDEIAYATAALIFAIADLDPDGTVVYARMSENDLDKPCDMLARLGIMISSEGHMCHSFARNWTP